MKYFLFLTVICLTGCGSVTLPLHGSINNGQEDFLGSVTGYADGHGEITMSSVSGVNCLGQFQYDNKFVTGSGTFECDDGRTGNFKFTSSGQMGHGFGKTNKGETIKFIFGRTTSIKAKI